MAKKADKKKATLGATPTKIKARLKARKAGEDKERKALEARMKKRGSYVGSPH